MPQKKELTGTQLFFRYAWPCARYRFDHNLITTRDFRELEQVLISGSSPNAELLERCFPNAVRELKELSERLGKEMWDIKTVRIFWRHNHCHSESPVICTKVVSLSKNSVVINVVDRVLRVINLYGLILEPEEEIFVHQHVVVEKNIRYE